MVCSSKAEAFRKAVTCRVRAPGVESGKEVEVNRIAVKMQNVRGCVQ